VRLRRWAPLAIFVFALIVRLANLFAQRASPFFLEPFGDPQWFLNAAHHPTAGVYFLSPGYEAFLRLVVGIWDGPYGYRVVQAVLGAATAALTFDIARHALRGFGFAIAAGLAVALCGPLVALDGWALLESPNAFLHAAACAALLRAGAGGLLWTTLGGAALGAAVTLRPSALLLVPLLALVPLSGQAERRKRLASAALGLTAAALLVAPVTLHNLAVGDRVLTTWSGGLNFYIGNGAGATGAFYVPELLEGAGSAAGQAKVSREAAERALGRPVAPSEVSTYLYDRALADVRAHPGAWLTLLFKKALYAVNWFELPADQDFYFDRHRSWPLRASFVGFGLLAPLAALGALASLLADERRRARLIVLAFAAAPLVTIVVFFYHGRYRSPALPFVAVLAALGLETLARALVDKQRRRLAGGLALVGAAALVVQLRILSYDAAPEYSRAGAAAVRLHRPDDAEHYLKVSLRMNPEYERSLELLGNLREEQARTDEARSLYEKLREVADRKGDDEYRQVAAAGLKRLAGR
jgi:4-amino-4-deoxy-L-arabinose transferase-like glycosyltransferase